MSKCPRHNQQELLSYFLAKVIGQGTEHFTSQLLSLNNRSCTINLNICLPRAFLVHLEALLELREIRENNLRKSATVVRLWVSDVEPKIYRLGHEKWVILEQVLIAALDVGNLDLAQVCLNHLRKRFPESSRVKRLYGMYLEASNKIDDARNIYKQILDKETTDVIARKRLITIFKAQGCINNAIDELNKYLKIFMADVEAWGELSDLYLAQGDYKHAAFCMEEVILANPHNHLLHERLAEIKYSEGGVENLELARAYFAQACRINPLNIRALYGLILAASSLSGKLTEKTLAALLEESSNAAVSHQYSLPPPNAVARVGGGGSGGGSFDSKRENHQLIIWAVGKLKKIYLDAGMVAPVALANVIKAKVGTTSRETPALPLSSSRLRGDYAALPEMFECLSTSLEESPRQHKK
ncbi:Tetratricopeptide repeat protein 35 [Echinococcus granulosus]|uniref:ER membrane protein complex subunit 2 n=1 Tax=Echinococcus granulosus TaxID=6210 RepID=W6UB04_ECHGR|nr:Tetratricopeptide repeat protein 35 [Echinococcus granulosus]EUB55642.1 Tetratricopeptide repeat protein 35 [Echinococcus granulosus]